LLQTYSPASVNSKSTNHILYSPCTSFICHSISTLLFHIAVAIFFFFSSSPYSTTTFHTYSTIFNLHSHLLKPLPTPFLVTAIHKPYYVSFAGSLFPVPFLMAVSPHASTVVPMHCCSLFHIATAVFRHCYSFTLGVHIGINLLLPLFYLLYTSPPHFHHFLLYLCLNVQRYTCSTIYLHCYPFYTYHTSIHCIPAQHVHLHSLSQHLYAPAHVHIFTVAMLCLLTFSSRIYLISSYILCFTLLLQLQQYHHP
jgi:hypothetical protein